MADKNYYSIDSYDKLFCKCDGVTTTFVDSATPAKTITANGNATQLPIKFNKSAGFFNGTTDYLILPDHVDLDFSGAFSIEGFFNFTSVATFSKFFDSETAGTGAIFHHIDNTIEWTVMTSSHSWAFDPSPNTWYFIQFIRQANGDLSISVDGSALTRTSGDGNEAAAIAHSGSFRIGGPGNYKGNYYMTGWIKELRISNVARTVAVPTAQYSSDANTVLLMHFDTPATSPLGPALEFDGNTDYVYTPEVVGITGTGDFTFESYIRPTVLSGTQGFMRTSSGTSLGVSCRYNTASTRFEMLTEGTTVNFSAYTMVINKWYHVAFVRLSGQLKLFVNGVQIGTDIANTSNLTDGPGFIGVDGAVFWTGFMRETQFSNTARYTANFVPSTSGYTIDANTKLYIKGNEDNGTATGKATNLAVIPGLTTWSWIIDSSQGTDPTTLTWPEIGNTRKDVVHDGSRDVAVTLGCSLGSTSGYFSGYLRATFAAPRSISKIYVKGNGAREEGNATGSRILSYRVNGTQINAVDTPQNSAAELSDSGSWTNVTTVDMGIYASYSRPSGGGFAYGNYYEMEIYGIPDVVTYSYIKDYSLSEKVLTVVGETKIKYTEDYRSCIFKDETGKFPYPVGSAKVDFMAIGSGVGYFDGTGDSLESADSSDWDFGTGDFTLEMYVRFNALGTPYLISRKQGVSGNLCDIAYTGGSGDWNFYINDATRGGGSAVFLPIVNTWYHIAGIRNGTSVKLFANGTQIGSTGTDSFDIQGDQKYSIGGYDGGGGFNGLMDNIRISKGVARYTAAFNPPEFTAGTNSQIIWVD